jgi:transcriptional regulator with XRE-family HTH domain
MNVNKLKGLMAENDITQQEIAKLLNISPTGLNKKLTGKSEFKASEIKILADFFKVSTDIFFKDNVTKNVTKQA